MIRIGGLEWALAVGVEFWHSSCHDGVILHHPAVLSQRELQENAVDRIGGAVERPTAGIAAGSAPAANDA